MILCNNIGNNCVILEEFSLGSFGENASPNNGKLEVEDLIDILP